MFTDLRHVLRSLARTRGFTAVTVLTLALGIGSAAAIFSVVDWILFRSMSYPSDLVMLGSRTKQSDFSPVTFVPQAAAYAALDSLFAETALTKPETVNVVVQGEPVTSQVMRVSPNFLPLVGATPAHGRGFLPDEGADGRDHVVVITDDFGREFFPDGGEVVGRQITVDQTACTIVGVLGPRRPLPLYVMGQVFRPTSLRSDARTAWQDWYLVLPDCAPANAPARSGRAGQRRSPAAHRLHAGMRSTGAARDQGRHHPAASARVKDLRSPRHPDLPARLQPVCGKSPTTPSCAGCRRACHGPLRRSGGGEVAAPAGCFRLVRGNDAATRS